MPKQGDLERIRELLKRDIIEKSTSRFVESYRERAGRAPGANAVAAHREALDTDAAIDASVNETLHELGLLRRKQTIIEWLTVAIVSVTTGVIGSWAAVGGTAIAGLAVVALGLLFLLQGKLSILRVVVAVAIIGVLGVLRWRELGSAVAQIFGAAQQSPAPAPPAGFDGGGAH